AAPDRPAAPGAAHPASKTTTSPIPRHALRSIAPPMSGRAAPPRGYGDLRHPSYLGRRRRSAVRGGIAGAAGWVGCNGPWAGACRRRPTARDCLWRIDQLRPGRDRPLLQLAVDVDIHLLVEEAEILFDAGALGDRVGVAPDDVLQLGAADLRRPVRRLALVRTARVLVRWREQVHAHVFAGNVVARGVGGLEQQARPAALGDGLAVDHDAHVAA